MYRVIAVVVGGLALAACSSNSQWLNLDALKPAPVVETVRFESTPPGADVKVSNGQTCRTPWALAIPQPKSVGYTAVFTLDGYLPDAEQIQLVSMGDNTSKLRPNPVAAQLTPAPPPKPKKKRVRHRRHVARPTVKKPKAKPAAAKPTPAPMQTAPQQAPSPWPPVQPQQR